MFDILIKNGTVIDGTGGTPKTLDVAIENGRIVEIDKNISAKAKQTIDATGLTVAPGFIDIQNHSDSYWSLFDHPGQASLLSQGITTIVVGHCGSSLAPLVSPESIKTIQKWHSLTGINTNWSTFAEYLQVLNNKPLGLNVASLVGHATIRRGIMGDQLRALSRDESREIEKLTQQSLEQGAFGLSYGLVYAHEANSTHDELVGLAKLLKSSNKFLSVHLRSESSHILESIDEAIDLSIASDVPVKISHLKVRGQKNWHLFEKVIAKLELAYHRGVKINFDVYPYDTSWNVLYTYLPKWAYEGGRPALLKNLSEPLQKRKILDYILSREYDYSKIFIAFSGSEQLMGKSIANIATSQNVSGAEAILNILSVSAQAVAFDHNLSTEQVEILCASGLSMIATDGAGFDSRQRELMHPRCFGTMPKFLRMVREKNLDKLEYAIKKITSDPAKLLGLTDRGILAKDAMADVVIFDAKTITDRSDYLNPDVLSEGIETVIINGKISLSGKVMENLNGVALQR